MSAVWLNGALVDRGAATVSVDDRGLTLGDGVFETVRVYGGTAFRLADHVARLRRGAERLGIPFPADLEVAVAVTIDANRLADGALRATLTRGPGTPGLEPPNSARPTVLVSVTLYAPPAWWYERGLATITASGRLNEYGPTAGLKTLGYAEAIASLREARAAGADDALRLDTAGHLAGGTGSNIFIVRDGALLTAPLTCGILPGITRATVLELAADAGLAVVEAPVDPDAPRGAAEVFLTSSLRELVPVVRLDGRAIGDARPGPVTASLLARYRKRARAGGGV